MYLQVHIRASSLPQLPWGHALEMGVFSSLEERVPLGILVWGWDTGGFGPSPSVESFRSRVGLGLGPAPHPTQAAGSSREHFSHDSHPRSACP